MVDTPLASLGVGLDDLAPTEFRAIDFDWTGLSVRLIRSADDEQFDRAYDALWEEFGHRHEMESRQVIADRLTWRADLPHDGYAMLYELICLHTVDGIAAVHDHTAVLNLNDPTAPLVVHISHILLAKPYWGTGLSGWIRALPLRTAREVLRQTHQPKRPITLVVEMEPIGQAVSDCLIRLRSYERGGFLKFDPHAMPYLQPDLRPPDEIDATGGAQPVPLWVAVRRVGRETETTITGREARQTMAAMTHIFRQSVRPLDMRATDLLMQTYPPDDACVSLLPPSQPVAERCAVPH